MKKEENEKKKKLAVILKMYVFKASTPIPYSVSQKNRLQSRC